MAPMTRSRAEPGDVPGELAIEYYRQRAAAGLIVSEGAQISQQGQGYTATPGVYTEAQVAGWRRVTDAVHAAGGRIFCQLWHVGRVSHPVLQPGGALPVAPSAVGGAVKVWITDHFEDMPVPRALDRAELPGIVEQFRHAAQCAVAAGFDGVELHAAGGYLLDQFMRDGANLRTDDYGGRIANRLRLLVEVVAAVEAVVGPGRTGVRIAPISTPNGILDSDPEALFTALVDALSDFRTAYLHVIEAEPIAIGSRPPRPRFDLAVLRQRYRGAYIVSFGYDRARADAALAEGRADLIAFGRPFIANPDLVARLAEDAPLAVPDPAYFYGGGAAGYIDYPALPR